MPKRSYQKTAEESIIHEFPVATIGQTVKDVEDMLVSKAKTFHTVDYVYIVDKGNVLKGVMSIKEVLDRGSRSIKVEDVMVKGLITAHPSTHQERLVYLALSHDLKEIPVVDKGGKLIGIVPYDTILQIFNYEVHEDMFKFGGIFHRVGKDFVGIEASAKSLAKHRLPWLMVGVLGGAFTAAIISSFEEYLGRLIVLAAFAPVLTYLSDAVGTQSETLAIRSMALKSKIPVRAYLTRELAVSLVLATVCGLMLSGIAMLGWRDATFGMIIGVAMFLSIIAAVVISTSLPFIFRRMNWDPAFASGPLATMISDITTITIYFVVASLLMAHAGA